MNIILVIFLKDRFLEFVLDQILFLLIEDLFWIGDIFDIFYISSLILLKFLDNRLEFFLCPPFSFIFFWHDSVEFLKLSKIIISCLCLVHIQFINFSEYALEIFLTFRNNHILTLFSNPIHHLLKLFLTHLIFPFYCILLNHFFLWLLLILFVIMFV